jgi:hypothetical protein
VVQADVPGSHRLVLGLGLFDRVELRDRFGNQPLDPRDAAGVGDRGEAGVDVRRCLLRQGMSGGGDPLGPPRRDLHVAHPGPDLGQPVGQVQPI